ncbi:type II toxin-antitoxin system Phd/YefM family antitoxin [Leifsonia sp. AG29]|uniref:type II toxin-antitoxin system Phd/YefM family antitoxin n=1 Tax=Leifsonia sp. AG29 TaxID=2598860 RepID=UPI001E2C830A|nr:type II toxin-antitoxin system Phd/YefM family antitoxin [Leifsonia sp. AG29]
MRPSGLPEHSLTIRRLPVRYRAPLGGIYGHHRRRGAQGAVRTCQRVNLDQTEVEITSKRASAVLISKNEYDSLLETDHLLRSPKNARRLIDAIESVHSDDITEHDLTGE